MTDWHMTVRRSRFLAFALGVIALAETVAAAAGAVVIGMGWTGAVDSYLVTNSAIGVAFAACGVLIAWHRQRNPVGWLLLGTGIAHLTTSPASSASSRWPAGPRRSSRRVTPGSAAPEPWRSTPR